VDSQTSNRINIHAALSGFRWFWELSGCSHLDIVMLLVPPISRAISD
jgi:hypothetical protein